MMQERQGRKEGRKGGGETVCVSVSHAALQRHCHRKSLGTR